MPRGSAKHWVFTYNNYPEEIDEIYSLLPEDSDSAVSYIAYGKEVGESGTPHLQGIVSFSRRLTLPQVKHELWSDSIHVEIRAGTFAEAKAYCEKDGVFVEFGEQPEEKGKRNDLIALRNDLQAGVPLSVISSEHFSNYIRYHRGIEKFISLNAAPRNWVCSVVVYWGATGTGKTRAVHENATSLYTHVGGPWFDGYEGHKQVLFDDFSGSDFKLPYLLKLLDRYPMQVPVKGGFVNWAPEEIYLTSNLNPQNWFPNAHREHVAALFRRFTFTFHFE